jgi:hypothetical protein
VLVLGQVKVLQDLALQVKVLQDLVLLVLEQVMEQKVKVLQDLALLGQVMSMGL